MKKPTSFDVLIVYAAGSSTSAASKKKGNILPFVSSHAGYNDAYSYFLELCAKNNLKAAFSTTDDIIGNGMCKSYWLYKNNEWTKVEHPCKANLIFDRFFPTTGNRELERAMLFSKTNVRSFISKELFSLFFDKYKTYSQLSDFAIPTIPVKSGMKNIKAAIFELKTVMSVHPNKTDFLDTLILKDRYGAGGYHVYKLEDDQAKGISEIMKKNRKVAFVIQPFVSFDVGYQYKEYTGFTEIRNIYLGQKIVQSYIRVAGNEDFLCNHGQCAIWVTQKEIPRNVMAASQKIATKLNKKNALFALDFIVSNTNNVFLLEGNTSPGLLWYSEFPGSEAMNKKMIAIIVEEISRRIIVSAKLKEVRKFEKTKIFVNRFPNIPLLPRPVL